MIQFTPNFKLLTWSLLIFLLVNPANARGYKWGGNFKTHALFDDFSFLKAIRAKKELSSLTSIRLNHFYTMGDAHNFEMAYAFSTQWAKRPVQASVTHSVKYRVKDLESTPSFNIGKNSHFYQNLDRFIWNYVGPSIDLYVGRQAVSTGSGRSVNPTDIFLPFAIGSFDSEYRTGIDAIRARLPFGDMGEFDGGIVLGENAKSAANAFFINVKKPIKDWDILYTAISYRRNLLLGLDLQGSLFSQGVWLEAAYNKMRSYKNVEKQYLRTVVGMDYRYSDDIMLYIEYQHNGAGTRYPLNYSLNIDSLAYREGGVFFLAKNYLAPGISIQITPLWIVSANAILNIDDSSIYYNQKVEWNFKDNFYGDFNLLLVDGKINSEFFNYSNRAALSMRIYY